MEIIQERIEREFNLDIITTAPSVIYKVMKTDGEKFDITNPTNLPPATEIDYMEDMVKSAHDKLHNHTKGLCWGSYGIMSREKRNIY